MTADGPDDVAPDVDAGSPTRGAPQGNVGATPRAVDAGPVEAVHPEADKRSEAQSQTLLPQHARLIRESAIADEFAAERGYRTVSTKAELGRLGFGDAQRRVPALLIPVWGIGGEIATYQIRPDEPRVVDGRATKYETPKGTRMVLDMPPRARPWLADPKRPLFITEGARKADAGVSMGLCTIAVLGVWNWRGTNEFGGKVALADWESIALNGRDVYLVFDSDVMAKPQVHAALARLKAFLESRGARVKVIYLQPGEGGTKVGLDDFFAAGGTVEQLLAMARSDLLQSPDDEHSPQPYFERGGALFWNKPVGDGFVPVQLANFTARITAEICVDDGVDPTREYEIEADVGNRVVKCRVPARSFPALNWAGEHLGVQAIVSPGFGARDHLRVAIQSLSRDVPRQTVYAHTGWRDIPGAGWVYLSGAGSIGPNGPVPDITVSLPDGLSAMALPPPPTGDALVVSVRAALDLLSLAPDRLSFPLLAAPFRAVMGDTDFSLFLLGSTGKFKTELAALLQAFFGAGFNARNLPGSWSSTGNSLEMLAFRAKDAIAVVDDFAPAGSRFDVQRFHRDADRVFRAQGNRSGRARLTSEAALRSARAPRGMVLATGEDLPPGHSMRARLLVLEVEEGDVDTAALTECQAHAAQGNFASAMAAFVQWVASAYPQRKAQLRERAIELRDLAHRDGRHRRTASVIAELQAGFEAFLAFCVERAVIEKTEADDLRSRCWSALRSLAETQARQQRDSDPATLFMRLLSSALASGEAHIAASDGGMPPNPESLGWRGGWVGRGEDEKPTYRPQGKQVGWTDGADLFFDPDAALRAAQAMADDSSRIAVSVDALGKRLFERGFLLSTEEEKDGNRRYRVRRVLQGHRRRVFHMALGLFLVPGQSGHAGQGSSGDGARDDDGPDWWPGRDPAGTPTGPTEPATSPISGHENERPGPSGPIGPGSAPGAPPNGRGTGECRGGERGRVPGDELAQRAPRQQAFEVADDAERYAEGH